MKWYLKVLSQYADFSSRAKRKEYWMFTLFHRIFAICAMILDHYVGSSFDSIGYGPVYLFYALALVIPGLAVAVRRLHDTGRSGFYLFVGIIPIIGAIWLIILMVIDGDDGKNEYGVNPKEDQIN